MIKMWDEQFAAFNPAAGLLLEKGDYRGSFEEMHLGLDHVWQEMFRVMKEGAYACINIGDAVRSFSGRFQLFSNQARIRNKLFSVGFDLLPSIIWRKQTNAPNKFMGSGMLPAGAYVTLEHEYILICRKGAKRKFLTAKEKKMRRQSAFFWSERNSWFSDLWDFKGARQNQHSGNGRERSAAFPFMLPFRLINMYSLLQDTVLDPFSGTGTTILAALASGRHSVGYEIDAGFSGPLKARIINHPAILNKYNLDRLKNQFIFARSNSGEKGALKYINDLYGCPVMTKQEEDLRLAFVQSVSESGDNTFCAKYYDEHYIRDIMPGNACGDFDLPGIMGQESG